MARSLRIVVPNGVYEVTAHGNRGQPVFTDEDDHRQYVRFLDDTVSRHGWRCLSYRLTPDSVQLVVQTPVPNLSEGMQRLQSRYAQWFNRRHGFTGHLFAGRFRSVLLELRLVGDTSVETLRAAVSARIPAPRSHTVEVTLRLCRAGPRSPWRRLTRMLDASARPPP